LFGKKIGERIKVTRKKATVEYLDCQIINTSSQIPDKELDYLLIIAGSYNQIRNYGLYKP